jgi:formylglycine-generating enzyme required for sulfatase activity
MVDGTASFEAGEAGEAGGDAAPDAGGDAGLFVACTEAKAGPAMIDAGTYCIDATEVTQAQYALFVAAKQNDFSGQPATCAWNLSWALGGSCAKGNGLPALGADWCDAYAYCRWAGKRLCGQIGGGASAPGAQQNASQSQWYSACSNQAQRKFAYGNTGMTGACNCFGFFPDGGAPADAGSISSCVGGISSAIHDMNGNAAEWTDSCDTENGANDRCYRRGGDFTNGLGSCDCPYTSDHARDDRDCEGGFRCCGDL